MSAPKKKRLFVAMPYGTREDFLDRDAAGPEIVAIDFDEVWKGVFLPAIPDDFDSKRADELRQPGLIDQLYNEWLFQADVVLADLTFSNPNVFYELGIRQALSKRGTVLVAQLGSRLPFDVRNQYVLNYDYFKAPSLPQFQKDLKMAIENAASHEADSPVHIYLPGLYVKKYKGGENPDAIINSLQKKVASQEAQIASFLSKRDQDRLFKQVTGTLDPKRLVALSNQILRTESVSIDVLEELAIRLRKVGRIQEALNILGKAHDQDPNDPGILRELGFVYRKMGEGHFDEAQKFFLEALKINNNDPELHGMIGGLLKRKKEYTQALEHYLKAQELIRDDLYSLVNLGAISAILGRNQDSEKYYKELLIVCERQISGASADYWTHLCRGEAAVALGDKDLAERAYKDALNFEPPIEDIRSASDQLKIFLESGIQPSIASDILSSVFHPLLS